MSGDLPGPRVGMGLAEWGGQLYMFGGYSTLGEACPHGPCPPLPPAPSAGPLLPAPSAHSFRPS